MSVRPQNNRSRAPRAFQSALVGLVVGLLLAACNGVTLPSGSFHLPSLPPRTSPPPLPAAAPPPPAAPVRSPVPAARALTDRGGARGAEPTDRDGDLRPVPGRTDRGSNADAFADPVSDADAEPA